MKTNLSLFDAVMETCEDEILSRYQGFYTPIRPRRSYVVLTPKMVDTCVDRTLCSTGHIDILSFVDELAGLLGSERRFSFERDDLCVTTGGYYSPAKYVYGASLLVPGLAKKFIGKSNLKNRLSAEERTARCIDDFINDNQRCKLYQEAFLSPFDLPVFSQVVIGEASVLLNSLLSTTSNDIATFSLSNLARAARSGPGSSANVRGPGGNFRRQVISHVSASHPAVLRLFKTLQSATLTGATTEWIRSETYGNDDVSDSIAIFDNVPKRTDEDRSICYQATANMHSQLAVHELNAVNLKRWGTDLTVQQDYNRLLARLGSLQTAHGTSRSWSFCTADLTSASNFPLVLVEWLFPEFYTQLVSILRSPAMEVPGHGRVEKYMCSTMGNGFTFSLMTLLLSAIVKALYSLGNLPEYDIFVIDGHAQKIRTWAVFGDDIIVDKSVYQALSDVLRSLSFQLNTSKSYFTGPFRESCGEDYYDGFNVRPVFCEDICRITDVYSLSNRLNLWCARMGFSLPRTQAVLLKRGLATFQSRRVKDLLLVPNYEDVSAGLHVPSYYAKRRDQYEIMAPRPEYLTVFREKVIQVPWSRLSDRVVCKTPYTYYVGKPCTLNLPGIVFFMMSGDVREGKVGQRPKKTLYNTVLKTDVPQWGDPTQYQGSYRDTSRYRSAVYRYWAYRAAQSFGPPKGLR